MIGLAMGLGKTMVEVMEVDYTFTCRQCKSQTSSIELVPEKQVSGLAKPRTRLVGSRILLSVSTITTRK